MKSLKKIVVLTLVLALSASLFALTASAEEDEMAWGAATVSAHVLNVRSAPGTDNSIIGSLVEDTIIVILEKTSDEWYKINYNGLIGYVASEYLKNELIAENFDAVGRVNDGDVRLREKFNTQSEILHLYQNGDELQIIGINTGWYKIRDGKRVGYIRSDLMDIIDPDAPDPESKSEPAPEPEPEPAPTPTLGEQVVNTALQFVGYPYVYSEESPEKGFDCSGLTWYVYKQYGYTLNRTAAGQNKNGVAVAKADLQPGDLCIFSGDGKTITHVGIYIGDGKFVHASNPTKGVVISELSSNYYTKAWVTGRRIVEE